MSDDAKAVRSIFVFPAAHGGGGTPLPWMAYFQGEEDGGARGWGTTRREAEHELATRPIFPR